jgi:hypothetical protein
MFPAKAVMRQLDGEKERAVAGRASTIGGA